MSYHSYLEWNTTEPWPIQPPEFADEETKAQGDEVFCPRSLSTLVSNKLEIERRKMKNEKRKDT